MIYRGLLICFLLPAFLRLQSQEAGQPSPQAAKGIEAFKNKNFRLAVSEFRDLLGRYPKDPLYHYYLGASLVASNADLSQGIELLKFVVSRNAVHEANYFLGLGYYRLYEFDKALQYYQQFKDEANISQLKDFSINQEMARIKMIEPYLKTVSIPAVVDKKTADDTAALFNMLVVSAGSFSACPPANECIRIFNYNASDQNSFFYYSAMSPYKIRGKEIYRVKKLPGGGWAEAENIGNTVNSMDNEEFPYFDEASQNLYFASRGHQGYGGYDVYKSHYDSVRKAWTKPENLGFPVNTPFDDIIYLPDKATGITALASNRENEYGAFTIYYLVNDDIFQTKDITSSEQLIQESKLAVNADEKTRLKFARSESDRQTAIVKEETEHDTQTEKIVKTEKISTGTPLPENYFNLISKALHFQARSDSLRFVSDALRAQTAVTPDDTERGKIQKEITQIETRAKELQARADKLYAEARVMELEHRPDQKANLYQKPEEKAEAAKKDTTAKSAINAEMVFAILPTSPYSDQNPIPIDVPYPPGVLYKIQLAVFNKAIAQNQFGGLKPVTGEKMSDGVTIKYYTGWFKTFADADSALRKVQENGFKSAFIVSYYNGAKLPVTRAKEMEKVD